MSSSGRKIHVWCPGLHEQGGGIEAYTLALVKAAVEWAGVRAITVCAKNEGRTALPLLSQTGCGRLVTGDIPISFRTAAFTACLVASAIIERPDLIIATHLNFSPVAAWLKRSLNIPYWISLHGVEVWNLRRTDRRRALCGADRLLPVSEFTRDNVMNGQSIPSDKFRVLHNTVDAAKFCVEERPVYLAQRYHFAPNDTVILTVGRLAASEAYKGQDRIIRVLPVIRQQVPRVRYLVVGDGDDRPRLEALATSAGVADAVLFAGHVPETELADHYRICDLFAMPSTGEGFGIVYLEAMACGKPVLGGNKDAAVDALRGGELGALVDPHDRQALASTIIAILVRAYRHPLMFQPDSLRAKVIEYFGLQKFNATVASYFDEFFDDRNTKVS